MSFGASDHRELRDLVRKFAERDVAPQAGDHDRHESFNRALFEAAGSLGLLGVLAPEEVGGAGLDATACALVHEELAWADPGFALAYLSHSVLFVNALARHGVTDVTRPVLQAACAGQAIGAVAMSEAGAGTDVLAMKTRAVQSEGGYVLKGTKMWITNGAQAAGGLAD
ncbi:MAG: acyl-CoA dehydrogenase family protein, partial [Pseudomonadota bacterium]